MSKTIRRRRKQGKTDYKARFHMLKSEKPRLVVRRTNRYLIAQIVVTEGAQDKVVTKVSSKELLTKGWPKEKEGSLKSLVAGYLTGFLLVKKIKEKPESVIFDLGLQKNHKGSRIYAVLKGAAEAGLNIPHDKSCLPSDERLKSSDKTKDLLKLKEKL